jgi:hypothetical protein
LNQISLRSRFGPLGSIGGDENTTLSRHNRTMRLAGAGMSKRVSQSEEFWHEQDRADRRDFRRWLLRWGLVFLGILLFYFATLWWTGSAVRFTASRAAESATLQYRFSGTVLDARTQKPIAWAELYDDPAGRPPHGKSTADHHGRFKHLTVSEPHTVYVRALGYRPALVRIGKAWYLWTPAGEETKTVLLDAEP